MKIILDITLEKFQTWSGATSTKERILEAGKEDEFDSMIEELYPEGLTNTQLNDLLWFDEDFIFESLGITEEDTDDEETEESEDE